MAPRLGPTLFFSAIVTYFTCFLPSTAALAAGLDERGESGAKEASRLYKQGLYEEAASIFARLSVEYPDMVIFERNLGACYYYLRKPEPALSNLRQYLSRKKNIAPDDKAMVDRWIDEMEKLRAQGIQPEPVHAAPLEPRTPASSILPAQVPPPPEPLGRASQDQAPPEATAKPAGIDLSRRAEPGPSPGPPRFYKTWWFWTGAAGVVIAGTVTAILLAHRSNDPCDGASHQCLGVK